MDFVQYDWPPDKTNYIGSISQTTSYLAKLGSRLHQLYKKGHFPFLYTWLDSLTQSNESLTKRKSQLRYASTCFQFLHRILSIHTSKFQWDHAQCFSTLKTFDLSEKSWEHYARTSTQDKHMQTWTIGSSKAAITGSKSGFFPEAGTIMLL